MVSESDGRLWLGRMMVMVMVIQYRWFHRFVFDVLAIGVQGFNYFFGSIISDPTVNHECVVCDCNLDGSLGFGEIHL